MVHVLSAQQNAPTTAPSINCSKPAQLPRPELQEEATEQDCAHWKVNWERYKRSCLIWKQVGKNVDTEQELLQLMKRMGVKKQNVLLNKVVFLDMSQDAVIASSSIG